MPDIILGLEENRILVSMHLLKCGQTNNKIKMGNAGSDVSKKCTHQGTVENAVKKDHAEQMPLL